MPVLMTKFQLSKLSTKPPCVKRIKYCPNKEDHFSSGTFVVI